MLRSVVRTVEQLMIQFRWPGPPPAFAVCPVGSDNVPVRAPFDIQRILQDFGIVFGVPKHRTSKPKKQTRKFSFNKLLPTKSNLITCQQCGGFHEIHTICGKCYEAVREATNDIKRQMMKYDPYVGEMPNKEVEVRYEGDEEEEVDSDKSGSEHKKRVITINGERPAWFSADLLRKWNK